MSARSVFLPLTVLLTLLHWSVLLFKPPVFAALPRWFWDFTDKPAGSPALLLLLVAAPLAVGAAVARSPGRPGLHLALLFLLESLFQFGLALTEGRGIDAIRDRMIHTGHAEFAEQAVRVESLTRLVSDYERLVENGELGRYAPSKPPGQLLLYAATEAAARWLNPQPGRGARLRWLRSFASYVWPVLSGLALVPLFLLGRLMADERTALLACGFYVCVPSVNLVTLHTDQVFFPALFTGLLVLAARAGRRGSLLWGAAAGAGGFVAAFCSFGLLPVFPLAVVLITAFAGSSGPGREHERAERALAGLAGGLVTADLVFRLGLGYDAWLRFRRASAYHAAWKGGTSGLAADLGYALMNGLEYALWLGLPITVVSASGVLRAAWRPRGRRTEPGNALALALAGVIVALAVFGKTQGEVARLWLFLVPSLCLVAALEFQHRFGRGGRRELLLVLFLQAGTVYLMKRFMDFV